MQNPKKVYVIGKFEEKEKVKSIFEKIEELGYEISYDWTNHIPIKPYYENQVLAEEYSENEMKALLESDIVIYLSTKEGTTSKLEIGGAMLLNIALKKPSRIYLVGRFNAISPWFMNSRVKRFVSIKEVFEELEKSKDKN